MMVGGELQTIEAAINAFFNGMIPVPLFQGLLVIVFFGGFVFLQGQRLDMKILIMGGAFLLAFGMLDSWIQVVGILIIALILYFGYKRIWR